jgi:hypothetical protein
VLNDGSAMAVGTIGRYDTELSINTDLDSQLQDVAGWNLHMMTVPEPRYTAINVDLANAALAAWYWYVLDTDLGDRLVVANPPTWLPPGKVDQVAQGVTEGLGLKDLYESWNGIPTTPWGVAYTNDAVFGMCDTDGSVVSALGSSNTTAAGTPANVWEFPPSYAPTGISWSVTNSVAALVPSPWEPGRNSVQVVATSSAAGAGYWQAASELESCTPGSPMGVAALVYNPNATAVQFFVNLGYFLSGTYVSSSSDGTATIQPGQFGWITTTTATAPASGINQYATVVGVLTGSAAGTQFYVKNMSSGVLGSVGAFTDTLSTPGSQSVEGWASPLWAADAADLPYDVSVGSETMRVLSAASTVGATITAPSQYHTLNEIWLPAGTWVVEWGYVLSGTVAGSETNAVTINLNGTWIQSGVNAAVAGTQGPYFTTLTVPTGGGFVSLESNDAGATGTYVATFFNPQTLGVLRSINGVSKAQSTGTDVRLTPNPTVAM